MDLKDYIRQVSQLWRTGDATEHSYRGALGEYVQWITGKGLIVVNEPARIECGAPDYAVMRASDRQPVFYIEAKDIGDSDLDGRKPKGHREQFDRYKGALDRIIFTDYLDFHFYEYGQWVRNIRLGEVQGDRIVACEDAEEQFTGQLLQWSNAKMQPIVRASRLASMMAQKARLLREVTARTMSVISSGPSEYQDSQLLQLYNAFKEILVSDLTVEGFADMYAQAIVYGLFAAKLHDSTPENFSREEAARLIPKSNPFLRRIFNNIAGIDLDDRVAWIVDDLVETFAATNVARVMRSYGRNDRRNDPMVHFYEDFLSRYDPKLRKDMGVWYTPKPVVGFIVRSVHELLRRELGMPHGLADTGRLPGKDGNPVHRLQILDPATGTGTFLAEVIFVVYSVIGRNNAGLWDEYVEKELKPRLNGFELMMAPYTIAHLKMDMVLHETGFTSGDGRRLNVFLTNSLEPPSAEPRNLFNAISVEAEEADLVKRDKPVMAVVGNPPYNGSSRNRGKWIMNLMEAYKREPGGVAKLNERNPKWLNDDYVKFIRLAEHYVEKNKSGIIGFINPHGFIDNPTFRGMRWHLLNTFDRIYVLNLHGNSKKKEASPDGGKDENVFDIMQGVSVNLFVRNGKKGDKELGRVFYADLWGKREDKLQFLESHDVTNVEYLEVKPQEPMYFFMPKNEDGKDEYERGFSITELFKVSSVGVVTTKDSFVVCDDVETVRHRIKDVITMPETELAQKYKLKDTRDWSLRRAKSDVRATLNGDGKLDNSKIIRYDYRPFDKRWIYYTGTTNGLAAWPRAEVQKNLAHEGNLAILTCRQCISPQWSLIGVSDNVVDDCRVSNKTKERGYVFPLYVYREDVSGAEEKILNLRPEVLSRIADGLGMSPEGLGSEDLLAYIYAVLHSPKYRRKYNEFLKIDFPRVPYPKDKARFDYLVALGRKLIDLHLMRGSDTWNVGAGFPESGTNIVERYEFAPERSEDSLGKVWINGTQYFSGVSQTAWNTCVGGYQPAQKWLKDRRGRHLSYGDIIHYERIIFALDNTCAIMQALDNEED